MAKISSTVLTSSAILELSQRHAEMKKRHPDAVLLFRVIDDFVLVGADAQATMRDLDIKPNVIDLPDAQGYKYLSFQLSELDIMLPRLIRRGHRVAIIDQLEDPKRVVKRGVEPNP